MTTVKAVEFEAEVRQIKTMADGSVNLTLNLPEYCMPQAKKMLDWLREQVRVVVEASAEPELTGGKR